MAATFFHFIEGRPAIPVRSYSDAAVERNPEKIGKFRHNARTGAEQPVVSDALAGREHHPVEMRSDFKVLYVGNRGEPGNISHPNRDGVISREFQVVTRYIPDEVFGIRIEFSRLTPASNWCWYFAVSLRPWVNVKPGR